MITRERLSVDVHQDILGHILRGRYAPGQRLKDTELAEELGVSRTPVREALLRLEREGFLSSQKHLGFSVKRMQESEILEVYPLVRLLECSALAAGDLPCAAKLAKMEEIGRSITKRGADPLKRMELDSAWHATLISENGNMHLMRILAALKRILCRYEYAFMQDERLVFASASEHDGIAAALGRGSKDEAVRLLEAHWNRCADATLSDFHTNGGRE